MAYNFSPGKGAIFVIPSWIVVILQSLLLLISTSSSTTTDESFINCFNQHDLVPSVINPNWQVLYTPNTTSFDALYLSSINNNMFLGSTPTPLFIIPPTHQSHVQASVVCGKKHGLRIRIRSGGHDFEGLSYRSTEDEPFLLVDLSRLHSIRIDTASQTAWVGAGATLGELYYHIANKSRTAGFPAGICPTVGVGGHFSGGGIGTMLRKYGLAADNVVDIQLVDVNGQVFDRRSMGEDLFWALRGGGGSSFGIILSYKVKLVEVPSIVTVFTVTRTLSQGAANLVHKWQHVVPKMVNDLNIAVMVRPVVVAGNRTIEASFQCLFLGRSSDLLPLMQTSFPELGVEAKDCLEMSWIESVLYHAPSYSGRPVEDLLDRRPQFHIPFKGKYDFVRETISKEQWEKIWQWLLVQGGHETWLLDMRPCGGRMDEIPEHTIPFPHRKGNLYKIDYVVSWTESGAAAAESHVSWMRRFHKYMTPYVSKNPRGAYINAKDLDLGRNEVVGKGSYSKAMLTWGSKYFKDNFERLALVKGRVDPDNYFWNEQSIPPLLPTEKVQSSCLSPVHVPLYFYVSIIILMEMPN